ncbi:hypothetical protein IV203_008739 [Nitzschia inconspicua]|uniref:Uncharacterized protein n=1 Tax=Nitzschia inconspicua TaxID=303405 RepID=A0A9K3PMZ6_9STRA|nr:hypothetical protein IV203_008739 [Nitzschia inconspicua]
MRSAIKLSSKLSTLASTCTGPAQLNNQPTTTTTHDDASPSDSCVTDIERVFRLIEDERHLSARSLYHSVRERINKYNENCTSAEMASSTNSGRFQFRSRLNKTKDDKDPTDYEKAQEMLEQNLELLRKLEDRCLLFDKAKHNLTIDDDWTLAQTMFGVTTYYRRESDGSLSIKLEGSLSGVSLFDQVAILREIDLHYKWAPFCSSSLTVCHLDKLDTVGWFCVGLPNFGVMRDGCFRAIGCDSIYEDGTVLLVAQGIQDRPEHGADNKHLEPLATDTAESTVPASTKSTSNAKIDEAEQRRLFDLLSKDPILEKLNIPPPPTRIGSGRMTIRTFQALINIESPTDATTKIVTNIDPNLPLIPQSLLDFLMKRLCGVLLSKMQGAAKKIAKDPLTNHHAVKMREERYFYHDWLLPKFHTVCKLRGWKMPSISAFELSEAQVDVANAIIEKKKSKTNKKAIKHAHTLSEDRLDRYMNDAEFHSFAESEPANMGFRSSSERGPKIRARTFDSDDFSELSRNSSSAASFLSSNPISKYLREIEERTQSRKEEEIEKSRKRAESRLKPKELDDESRSRLQELRNARGRQSSTTNQHRTQQSNTTKDVIAPVTSVPTTYRGRDWAIFWTRHGIFTKMTVLSLLTGSLFGLLYSDLVFEEVVASHGTESLWISTQRDAATVAYVGSAGLLHFFLCYVALMYAFSALQLGSIAGKQVKKFYSENVHLIVAVTSTTMVAMGAIYTAIYNSCQWVVWKAHVLLETVWGWIPSFPAIPKAVSTPFLATSGIIMSIFSWVETMIVESNFVGRGVRSIFRSCWGVLANVTSIGNSFVALSIGEYKGTVPASPWREQAFYTARALLSYSAIFLMVLLFSFNLMAWHARHVKKIPPNDSSGKVHSDRTSEQNDTPVSKNQTLNSRSMSPLCATIQEED